MKTISSMLFQYMFSVNWCVVCGKITDMKKIPTHLPGINARQCPICNTGVQCNYIDDVPNVQIPDEYIIIPDDLCPVCKTTTKFKDIVQEYHNKDYDGEQCTQCGFIKVNICGEIVKILNSPVKY